MPTNREIYHKPCVACKRKGFFLSREKINCKKCESKGWVTVDKQDRVCSACDGDGLIKGKVKIQCDECKGKSNITRVVEEISIEYYNCNSCDGLGKVYYWKCSYCFDSETYDAWDCKSCRKCDSRCVKVLKFCDHCHNHKYQMNRTLKDIKTGELYYVNELAPQNEDDEHISDDYLIANAKAWIEACPDNHAKD